MDAVGKVDAHSIAILAARGRECPELIHLRGGDPVSDSVGDSVSMPAAGWSLAYYHRGFIARLNAEGVLPKAQGVLMDTVVAGAQKAPLPMAAWYPAVEAWTSVRDTGAVGDGKTDDTAAFTKALETSPAVYVPPGRYVLSDTVTLAAGSRIFSLHPRKSVLRLPDNTPGFTDAAQLRPLLTTAVGGNAVVHSLGFSVSRNAGAQTLLWQAGAESRCADLWFTGDGGDPARDSVYASLHVRGGGGTFCNIINGWDKARFGMLIEDTAIPSRVELVSLEHHRESELVVYGVKNWHFSAVQTERGDDGKAHPAITLTNSQHLTFANPWLYRTSSSRADIAAAITTEKCADLRFTGTHVFAGAWKGGIAYRNFLHDLDRDLLVGGHQLAVMTVE